MLSRLFNYYLRASFGNLPIRWGICSDLERSQTSLHQIRLIHAGIQPESERMLHLSLGGEVRQLTDTDHVHRTWTAEVHVQ